MRVANVFRTPQACRASGALARCVLIRVLFADALFPWQEESPAAHCVKRGAND